MTTREAIGVIAGQLTNEIAYATTGYTSRDLHSFGDRPNNFYMIGSMGIVASLGLGTALARPKSRVVVFDGDGSVLMGLGGLTMIGALKPKNLIHLVFDNEVFASTGKQPTYSTHVRLDALAQAAGYPAVSYAQTAEDLLSRWDEMIKKEGPVFILIKCRPDTTLPQERIRVSPEEMTERFRRTAGVS